MKESVKLAIAASVGLVLTLGSGNAQTAANLLGIDVASYQGAINWASVYSCGTRFAFAKATEGNYYTDAYFVSNMVNGKAAGLQMGAYHFARPDLNCPSTEANYFWGVAGKYIIADGKSIFPVVDFEVFNGHVCQPDYTTWFNVWAADVKAKTPHFLHPVIYAGACGGMCLLGTNCTLSAFVAGTGSPTTGNPWGSCSCCNYVDPCTGNGWTYWQFSTSGSVCGVSGNCDLDTYNGTLAQLIANEGVH